MNYKILDFDKNKIVLNINDRTISMKAFSLPRFAILSKFAKSFANLKVKEDDKGPLAEAIKELNKLMNTLPFPFHMVGVVDSDIYENLFDTALEFAKSENKLNAEHIALIDLYRSSELKILK